MSNGECLETDNIQCPKCGEIFKIGDTLRSQLLERTRVELQLEFNQRQQTIEAQQQQLNEREKRFEDIEMELEQRVRSRIAAQQEKLTADALAKARAEMCLEVASLRTADQEKNMHLEEFRNRELELRKVNRQLEFAKQQLELEVARRLDMERCQIREDALKEAVEAHRLKDAEKDNKLGEALRMNEELRRKLEQGSQQSQGEVLELELERVLRDSCRHDEICEVPKGVRGADILQRVHSRTGIYCGSIIWEAKNTKHWSDQWISKLKEDQRASNADVAVIVTEALPKGFDGFGPKEGVWITNRKFVPALVAALRQTILEIAQAKRAAAGKNDLVEALFDYATGPLLRNRVETIARNFVEMKEDLEQEKRTVTRRWAKRSKQLDLIIANTSEMYGELQGFVGKRMSRVELLDDSEATGDGDDKVVEIAAVTEKY